MKAKLTFIMFAVMILFAAAPAYADGLIFGRIYYNDDAYGGATVNATCDGGNTSNTVVSAGNTDIGFYALSINCTAGSTVTVESWSADGSLYGSAPGIMNDVSWLDMDVTDVDEVDVTMIPEFGLIAIPLLLSMAGFVFMKGRMI